MKKSRLAKDNTMKAHITKILQHPLITGSTIIFLGTLLANVFNFLFTAYMLRTLPDGDKGTLFALISLITLPSIAANAISPSIVNFSGVYFAKGELAKVHGLYIKVAKLYLGIGTVFFVLFLLSIPFLSEFFKIPDRQLMVWVNLIIFIGFFNVINISILQAKLAFTYLSFISILGAVLKLILGFIFVYAGFAVGGAVLALVLSALIPFLFSFIPIRFIFNKNIEKAKVNTREIISYGLPSALTILGLTSFITSDILMVKHFFSPGQADFYSGISIVGRVIFYFSSPIGTVMFPLIVQKMSKGEKYTGTFMLSMLLVLLPSACITLCYFFLPEFILNIFGIQNNTYDANLLWQFGMFISLYALVSVLINFYLSIKKTIIFIPVIFSALLQLFLVWNSHADFTVVIMNSTIPTFLLLVILLLYYPYATKKK